MSRVGCVCDSQDEWDVKQSKCHLNIPFTFLDRSSRCDIAKSCATTICESQKIPLNDADVKSHELVNCCRFATSFWAKPVKTDRKLKRGIRFGCAPATCFACCRLATQTWRSMFGRETSRRRLHRALHLLGISLQISAGLVRLVPVGITTDQLPDARSFVSLLPVFAVRP